MLIGILLQDHRKILPHGNDARHAGQPKSRTQEAPRVEPNPTPVLIQFENPIELPNDEASPPSGPLFVEDFAGEELNRELWHIVNGDPGIEIDVTGGELRIHGKTGTKTPEHYNHVGVFGKVFRCPDVVAVARIRVAVDQKVLDVPYDPSLEWTENLAEPAEQRYIVHLCGVSPDYNSTVFYGAYRGQVGWFLRICNWIQYWWNSSPLPPTGNESDLFTTVRVEHLDGISKGYILTKDGWTQVGTPQPCTHGLSRLELKVVISPRDQPADMRVADCRMYLHPAKYPVHFIIANIPWSQRLSAPVLLAHKEEDLVLELFEADSGLQLGSTTMDKESGSFTIDLSPEAVYPVAAEVVIRSGDKTIARGAIPVVGMRGLYPGEVYMLFEGKEQNVE